MDDAGLALRSGNATEKKVRSVGKIGEMLVRGTETPLVSLCPRFDSHPCYRPLEFPNAPLRPPRHFSTKPTLFPLNNVNKAGKPNPF